jgi:hypothetical protein
MVDMIIEKYCYQTRGLDNYICGKFRNKETTCLCWFPHRDIFGLEDLGNLPSVRRAVGLIETLLQQKIKVASYRFHPWQLDCQELPTLQRVKQLPQEFWDWYVRPRF